MASLVFYAKVSVMYGTAGTVAHVPYFFQEATAMAFVMPPLQPFVVQAFETV